MPQIKQDAVTGSTLTVPKNLQVSVKAIRSLTSEGDVTACQLIYV